jgi:hypothetical protein
MKKEKEKKLVIGWIDPSNRFRPYPILKFRFSSSSSNRRLVFYYKSERENLLFALLTSARVSVDRAPRTYKTFSRCLRTDKTSANTTTNQQETLPKKERNEKIPCARTCCCR